MQAGHLYLIYTNVFPINVALIIHAGDQFFPAPPFLNTTEGRPIIGIYIYTALLLPSFYICLLLLSLLYIENRLFPGLSIMHCRSVLFWTEVDSRCSVSRNVGWIVMSFNPFQLPPELHNFDGCLFSLFVSLNWKSISVWG